MTNLDSILKSRDITLLTKACLVKAMVFPVVMYGCESWTLKKAERERIDAFELWCWRRLLRVPWTAGRSNQSILKEISPEYSLEGLMLKLKLQYFGWVNEWSRSVVSDSSNPMDCSPPGSTVHGILQARILEWLAISFSWGSSQPRDQTHVSCLAGRCFNLWATNTLASWCKELTHLKRPWCWKRLKAGGEADDRGWDGWMTSPTQWTWVWVNSGGWWWTGKPGVLQSMELQRVRHHWATELNWAEPSIFLCLSIYPYLCVCLFNLLIYLSIHPCIYVLTFLLSTYLSTASVTRWSSPPLGKRTIRMIWSVSHKDPCSPDGDLQVSIDSLTLSFTCPATRAKAEKLYE